MPCTRDERATVSSSHGSLMGGAEHSLLLLLDALAAEGVDRRRGARGRRVRERVASRGIPTTVVSISQRIRRVGYGAPARRGRRWPCSRPAACGLAPDAAGTPRARDRHPHQRHEGASIGGW
jgi:hypothetical protein